jgi:Phosphodiester glycosidase
MRSFPALFLACLLAGAAAPTATGTPADPAPDSAFEPGHGRDRDPSNQQTSDGKPGQVALPIPRWMRGPTEVGIRNRWTVAPGVEATVWDERDARGPTRYYLLTVNLRTKGLSVDFMNAGPVRRTAPVPVMLASDKHAVGGVNGDFFDIGDTGAPLGLGKDRQRGALNGRVAGWNNAFFIDAHGHPDIDVLPMLPSVKDRPGIKLTNVNSPSVQVGGIGAYNRAWGLTAGYRVVDGQTRDVRMVLVRDGKVVRSSTKLSTGKAIDGVMLVGRGAGATALSTLKVGMPAQVRWHVQGAPKMAITGNKFLVRNGLIQVVDDREMHPRTAIGIDRSSKTLLLLVVDGRQSFSRGNTMVELANKMIDLGADEALNLDGGGSSTMMADGRAGNLHIVNSPSDGFARPVANGLEILYNRPH